MAEKFIGTQYPLRKTSRGTFAQKNGVDQIKSDLLQLLLTNPGERVMLAGYGTPLRELQFEPNDPTIEIQARNMIADSIRMWEPRVVIQNIEVTSQFDGNDLSELDDGTEVDSILGIKIEFIDPENIQQIEALFITLPIEGSSSTPIPAPLGVPNRDSVLPTQPVNSVNVSDIIEV